MYVWFLRLGSNHDLGTDCPSGRNVMSPYLFTPDVTTVDTHAQFSTCSVSNIQAHLAK